MALLTDSTDVIDKEYKDLTAEMYANGHSFFTYLSDNPDALASCCRLRNEMSGNTFNFTTGLTGVATGSVNVITLNLNRIIQNFAKRYSWDELKFGAYLSSILTRVYKYHTAYKDMLYELYENNMLPVYKAGYISLEQQYSTIGINGLNEAAEFIGYQCSDNLGYKYFCKFVTGVISKCNKHASTKKIKFNQEFVPKSVGTLNLF